MEQIQQPVDKPVYPIIYTVSCIQTVVVWEFQAANLPKSGKFLKQIQASLSSWAMKKRAPGCLGYGY